MLCVLLLDVCVLVRDVVLELAWLLRWVWGRGRGLDPPSWLLKVGGGRVGSTTLGGTTPTLVTFFTELTLLKMSSRSSSGTDSRKVLPVPRLGSAASNGEASAESAASASPAPGTTHTGVSYKSQLPPVSASLYS